MNRLSDLFIDAIAAPFVAKSEVRYLKLRGAWERYANRNRLGFSEQRVVGLPFTVSDEKQEEFKENLAERLASDGRFSRETIRNIMDDSCGTTVARISAEYRGFQIRVQSGVDFVKANLCCVRVKLAGNEKFAFTVHIRPNPTMQLALNCGDLLLTRVKAYREMMAQAEEDAARGFGAKTDEVVAADLGFRKKFSLRASEKVREFCSSERFVRAFDKASKLLFLSAVGTPDARQSAESAKSAEFPQSAESFDADEIFAVFFSGAGQDELDSMLNLTRRLLDELVELGVICAPSEL